MTAAEVDVWREYQQRYGFETDRIVWTIANVGAAVAQGKMEPKDFIPRFQSRRMSNQELIAALSSLPGAKVRKRPRKERVDGSGQLDRVR